MSARQTKIIQFLRYEPSLTAWQLSQSYRIGAPVASVRRDIAELRQKGWVIMSKPLSGGRNAYVLGGR